MYNLLGMLQKKMGSEIEVLSKINEIYQKRADKGLVVRAKKERIKKSFNRDPHYLCPKCEEEMILYKIRHPKYGVIYDYLDDLLKNRSRKETKDEKEQEKTKTTKETQLCFSF